MLVLATTSEHKKRVFDELGLKYRTAKAGINERFEGKPSDPKELVEKLSHMKAECVSYVYPGELIVGFDSVGYINEILEKPANMDEARERLRNISDKHGLLYTGVHIIKDFEHESFVSTTAFKIRCLSEEDIEHYLSQGEECLTFALGFDPMNKYSSTFIDYMSGSYNNLLKGIPVEKIVEKVKRYNEFKRKD